MQNKMKFHFGTIPLTDEEAGKHQSAEDVAKSGVCVCAGIADRKVTLEAASQFWEKVYSGVPALQHLLHSHRGSHKESTRESCMYKEF